ncbi:undecaprenyl/decaprenyl-phosphate alpha-N-acetylglucosaminyl 1-phosphate transferase [candidate division WS5 bacterium]|uniref:Undecaprenyl/decaprenyl-phosphate alpha-N-acetylglucosaminyl 1-phosphate transferase n=1 Tax=candidate division WS5 bacterium TaxID=2093353 RepID=A0A419DGP3_9BACT|nr:MAG: undecaprenyl/decaprenyl-phosphate alpha-N-acetylglucosaminyl 1-phosphate transferase [candidate division WS5 bacterium]
MIGILAFSLAGSYILSGLVRKALIHFDILAHPGERKVHKIAVPEGGGIAIFIAVILTSFFFIGFGREFLGFYIGASIMFLMGLLDDVFDVRARYKLAGQIVAVILAMYFGLTIQFVTGQGGSVISVGILALPLTFIWLLGVTNAINLIDGLDGLAGGVGAIVSVTLGIVALGEGRVEVAMMAFILAAATVGFLPHNFSKDKKMFMGDSGSQFLGFSLAALAILGVTKVAATFTMLAPIMILGIPIFDTIFAIIRRKKNGKKIFVADRGHLHHRLLDLGFTERKAVTFIYYVTILLGFVAVFSTKISPKNAVILFVITVGMITTLSFMLSRQHKARR